MTALSWVLRAARYDQVTFWRTPGPLFAIGMPVVTLVVFGNLSDGEPMSDVGGVSYTRYLAVGMLAFTLATTAYGNLAARVTHRRETGIFQRLRTTPLPAGPLIAGIVASTLLILLAGCAAVLVTGVVLFDAQLPTQWPLFAATFVLGAGACCAAGVAVSTFVSSAEVADPVVFGTMMPVLFVSGVFQHVDPASLLGRVGSLFPLHHVVMGFADASDVPTTGGGSWDHLTVLAGWLVTAGLLAIRRFRWAPSRS